MSHTQSIEWCEDRDVGFMGRKVRITVRETIPQVSWKATVEELVEIPGTSYLRLSGRKLSEGGPTRETVKAFAPLLVARLLADVEGQAA